MAHREPWLRFYIETAADKKIKRIATVMHLDKYMVVGAWAIILTMAKASPIEGSLFIASNVPATLHDIGEEMGIESYDTLAGLMRWFIEMEMIEVLRYEDREFYHLLHWHERQFRSDISADRVREHRQRKKEQGSNDTETFHVTLHETKDNENEKGPRLTTPENETLQGRYMKRNSNTPDTDTESDTDTDIKPSISSGSSKRPNVFRTYEREIGPLTPMIADRLKDAEQTYPKDWIPIAIGIAAAQNKRSMAYVEGILKRWKKDGFNNDSRPAFHGGRQTRPAPILNEALRKVLGMADDE
jgi:DnaD/phage-associated family protein